MPRPPSTSPSPSVAVDAVPLLLALADLNDFPADFAPALAPAETARARTFTHAPRRRQYAVGRWLLRVLLREAGFDGGATISAEGRPAGPAGSPFALALSHSRDWVAAALGPQPWLGIDLELARTGTHPAALARRYFAPDEAAWVGDSTDRFLRLWTHKEAWLKAAGCGIAGGLQRFILVPGGGGPRAAADRAGQLRAWPWEGGWLTLVTGAATPVPQMFRWRVDGGTPLSLPPACDMPVEARADDVPASR